MTVDTESAAPRRALVSKVSVPWLIAVLGALLTAVLVLSWMRAQDQVVTVITAGSEIRSGSIITEPSLELVEVPAAAAFGDALLGAESWDALVGRVATRTVAAGEPVLRSDSREVATATGLRAMSLQIEPAFAVGGDLVAGDAVDVVVVDGDATVRYVATGVTVLAVPSIDAGGLTGAGSLAWFVTLAVDADQVLAIAQGKEVGTVHVVRSTGTAPARTWSW